MMRALPGQSIQSGSEPDRGGPASDAGRRSVGVGCIETRSRELMSKLVHDVTAEAFRLNLYGAPAGHVEKANGAPIQAREQVKNG